MKLELARCIKLHEDKVWSLDFSRGLLASGSTDRRTKIVSIKPEAQVTLVDELDDSTHSKSVRSVAWRPGTSILATGSFDTTVSIWTREETEEGEEYDSEEDEASREYSNSNHDNKYVMELLAIIEGHENEVKSVAWSYDGSLLATCARDKSVWIWETDEIGEEYECISVLQEHSQDVKNVVWHPSLPILASSSYDDTIRIWTDYDDDWECSAVLNGHKGTVWSSDFEKSNNNSNIRLCSGSDDCTVRVWKKLNKGEVGTSVKGTDDINDGNANEEEDEEEENDIYDNDDKWICEAILPQEHTRSIYSVSWGPNGMIASAGSDGKLVIYHEVEDKNEKNKMRWEVLCIKELIHGIYECNIVKWIDVEGELLLATGGDDGYVNLWKLI